MPLDSLANSFFPFIAGSALSIISYWTIQRTRLGSFKKMGMDIIAKAELDADTIRKSGELIAKQVLVEKQREADQHWQQERLKLQREEDRLKQREDKLESRLAQVEKKITELERKEIVLQEKKKELESELNSNRETKSKLMSELEKVAGLSSIEAKEALLQKLSLECKTDAANYIRKIKKEAQEEADREASSIIATAITRLAVPCTAEFTVNTVSIPNEEMKGRIIGREGRNIRTLERVTGVNFIIDDTPGAVVLSGFDPVRLHIAKMALTDLVNDGRIHPTRIEEAAEKAKITIQKQIKAFGEDAALRAGCINLHPEIITLLGKLKFRYSFGQNVLDHSLEVSHLLGMMAAELGLDVRLAKRIGLLHDMGKAVTHEVEGSHAMIGHDLSLRYGETKEVANGIGCHHFEIDPITIEASLCSAADAISASRQGARSEPVEEYIKRLKKLEDIAAQYPGVKKAFALQAGREVRVEVLPDMIDDIGTMSLAKDLTKRIEEELRYSGKIKITVLRETKAVEYAM